MINLRYLNNAILALLLFTTVSSEAFAQNKLAYIVVEGLDSLHLLAPDIQVFRDRRERVHVLEEDQLEVHSQSGYLNRRFADSLGFVNGLFNSGEMAVVNKVGFSTQICDHKQTRKLLGRGVDQASHTHTNGWLIRTAPFGGWTAGARAWDTTQEGYALTGSGFVGHKFYNISDANNDTRQFNSFNHRDSTFREDIMYANQANFPQNSTLASNFTAQSLVLSTALNDIRGQDESGDFNDVIEDVFGRAAYAFTRHPDIARVVVGRVPATFGFRNGNEPYGFDTNIDQRDTYNQIMDNLDDAIEEFREDMINANIWGQVILVVVPDFGRSIYATGIIDTNRGDNDGDTRGTACGHAGDAWVFGDPSSIQGGFYGAGYSLSQISSSATVAPSYTHTQLLHASIEALGLDADPIIDLEGRSCLVNLFDRSCS